MVVRTRSQLAKVVRDSPFLARGEDEAHLHVVFTDGPAAAAVAALDLAAYAPEEAIAVGKELHLLLPNGVGRSKLAADLGRQKGTVGTTRNWRTVTTLLAMADEAAVLTWSCSSSTRSARCSAGLLPPELGELRTRHHRYGIKVWFGPAKPTREHYEAQVIGAKHVAEATVLAIEVGYHAEHRDPADNERALARAASAARSGGARCSGPRRWRASSSTTGTAGSACRRPGPTPTSATRTCPRAGHPPHRLHHRAGAAPGALISSGR